MLLTNHTLTGTLLGLAIDDPYLLAPTAVASHLVLDMTPHFGLKSSKGGNFRDPGFIVLGSLDFAVSAAVVTCALLIWPHRAVNILIGVIGAALPDLTYIPLIVFGKRLMYKLIPGYRSMIGFLARIQWYEKTPGLITEVIWAWLMIWLLQGLVPA